MNNSEPPLREEGGALPPLDLMREGESIVSHLIRNRVTQLREKIAENESLKAQLSTVLARESATTGRYDAKLADREKMLGVVREYRHIHHDCVDAPANALMIAWDLRCSTCKSSDLLLSGEEKG